MVTYELLNCQQDQQQADVSHIEVQSVPDTRSAPHSASA